MEENKSQLKAEFETSVNAKDLMNFKVYHNYHSVSGIATLLIGVIMLVLCGISLPYENANISYILITGFFGLFFTVWTPIGMWLSVRKQMKKAQAFHEPVKYMVTTSKITLSQGEIKEELLWEDIFKVICTGKSLVLYITTVRANIIPLESLGDAAQPFIKIARERLRPFQVKLNDTKVIEKCKELKK